MRTEEHGPKAGGRDAQTDANLYSAIDRIATLHPDRVAVVTPAGHISFAGLDGMVAKAAAAMRGAGLKTDDRIGIVSDDDLFQLVCALACARIGIAHLVIPSSISHQAAATLAGDLDLVMLLRSHRPSNPAARPLTLVIDRALIVNGRKPPSTPIVAGGGRTWLILVSSGTTGSPKYAELSHDAAMQRCGRYPPFQSARPEDLFFPLASLDFVAGKQRAIFSLMHGMRLCLSLPLRTLAERLSFAVEAGLTHAWATPFHIASMLERIPEGRALPDIRVFEVSTSSVSEPLRLAFRQKFTANLHISYATNESLVISIASPAMQEGEPGCVGMPAEGMEVEIVDGQARTLEVGEVGHVRVRGPGLVSRYLNNPEATARSFRDGWFYPGDLASFSAKGAIVLHGRADDMMIFDGIKIYPAEIERALASHPAVAEAVAYPIPSQRHQHLPAAAVILRSPAEEADLIAHCRAWLGSKAPITIRILRDLPRNAVGKVLKRELVAGTIQHIRALQASKPGSGGE